MAKNNEGDVTATTNAAPPAGSASSSPTCDISTVPALVQQLGLVNFNVKCNNGELVVSGTSANGKKYRVSSYDNNGYTEGTMSSFNPGQPADRKKEAVRLRNTGLSQQEIANRLGVSQKTISNDLKR